MKHRLEGQAGIFFRGVNFRRAPLIPMSLFETRSEHEGETLEHCCASDQFEIAAIYAGWVALDLPKELIGNLAELVKGTRGEIYVFRGECVRELRETTDGRITSEMAGFEVRPIELIETIQVIDGIVMTT